LTVAEMPAHEHDIYYNNDDAANGPNEDTVTGASADIYQTSSVGGDDPHNNVQPVVVTAKMIRYAASSEVDISSTTAWNDISAYLKFYAASRALTLAFF